MAEKMVDQIMRLTHQPHYIRNIGVCAHIDHGKTTFSDNLLAGAGMISDELAGKQLVLDFREDEKERGITIDAASVSMVHQVGETEYLINLIDTPGHVDFGGDVTRAMRAVDGAIVLVCSSEGVMPQTETVLRQALRERVKPVLFLNKVDRLIRELKLTPEQMQQRFIKHITDVNTIIRNIAPEEFKEEWQVNIESGSVAFGSAFHKWAISLHSMQKKGITFKHIIDAYTSSDEDALKQLAKKAPLHEVILDMAVKHHPHPVEAQHYRIPWLWKGEIESADGQALINCDPNGRVFFVITKVVIDPQAGEICGGRLFSGTMRKGEDIYLNMAKMPAKVQQVFVYNGAKREIVDNVPSGNIIGIAGLRSGLPGETVSSAGKAVPFEEIKHIFEPVVSKAIEAKKPGDLPKLIEVLRQVQKEDPSIVVEINEETGEHLIHGMGELHLEVIENRIFREKGVDIKTSPPIVVYRETVTRKGTEVEGKSPNKHNKLYFIVEPLEANIAQGIKEGKMPTGRYKKRDDVAINFLRECGWDAKTASSVKAECNGNILMDQTRGIVHIGEILEMVLDMFEDVMKAGPLAKEPCINVKVSLTDCSLHEDAIHRGPAQMYPAVREGIRGAMMTAGPILYEPLQVMRIEAPNEYVGGITKLVASKRGQLLEMQQEGQLTIVTAKIPVGELFGWINDLRSATEGRGNSSLVDQMFERLSTELQEKIKKQIIQRKGLTEAMLGA